MMHDEIKDTLTEHNFRNSNIELGSYDPISKICLDNQDSVIISSLFLEKILILIDSD